MSQYIGKTISLISNKGLRYVGLLDKISAEDATVSLKSVRPFGTEGRMAEQGQPSMEVMPGNDVYEYVVFRGSDVKDLSVLDVPIDQVRPVVYYPPPVAETSAQNAATSPGPTAAPSVTEKPSAPVLNTTRDSGSTQEHVSSPISASPAGVAALPRETGNYGTSGNAAPAQTQTQTQTQSQNHVNPAPTSTATPTKTETQEPTKTRPQGPRERAVPVPQQDYDFEAANSRFEKERQQDGANKPTYDKKSLFFDTISLNEHSNNSMRWNEEKNLNMDTFGEAYARRGRGGFRGGRGGRGRGNGFRGRGRGNYRGRGSSEPKPEWA